MNGLIRMVVNMVVHRGISHGVDVMAKRRTDAAADDPVAQKQAADTTKRSRQTLRILRRLFRF